MDLELKGKTAIVTGGNRGIGKAIARELAREGVNVAMTARDKAALEKTAAEIARVSNSIKVLHLSADTGDDAAVKKMVADVVAALRPHRHPRQLRGQAERTGQAAGAGRDHQRALLGPT